MLLYSRGNFILLTNFITFLNVIIIKLENTSSPVIMIINYIEQILVHILFFLNKLRELFNKFKNKSKLLNIH